MKKAFLMLEVIISIVLLSGVMLALFKVNDNGFMIVKKVEDNRFNHNMTSIVGLNYPTFTNSNITVFLDKLVSVSDDDIRQRIKAFKIKMKQKMLKDESMDLGEISITVTVYENQLSWDDTTQKKLYSIKLQ
jgi:hypothetical protein